MAPRTRPPADRSGLPEGPVHSGSGDEESRPDGRGTNPQRRERVLRAAAEAIAERGFADTRIADIADRAGMSPGHVMYYFSSKEELLLEALRFSEDSRFYDGLAAELDRAPGAAGRLARFIELSIPGGARDEQWTLWLELWTRAVHDPTIVDRLEQRDARWTDALAAILREGIADGSFDPVDIRTCEELSMLLTGYAIQITSGMPSYPRDAAVRACVRAAHERLGIAADPSNPPPA
ncbi:MAG: TetR/AcrR family transcriptional regulator [Actinomycetota bacterium]